MKTTIRLKVELNVHDIATIVGYDANDLSADAITQQVQFIVDDALRRVLNKHRPKNFVEHHQCKVLHGQMVQRILNTDLFKRVESC